MKITRFPFHHMSVSLILPHLFLFITTQKSHYLYHLHPLRTQGMKQKSNQLQSNSILIKKEHSEQKQGITINTHHRDGNVLKERMRLNHIHQNKLFKFIECDPNTSVALPSDFHSESFLCFSSSLPFLIKSSPAPQSFSHPIP